MRRAVITNVAAWEPFKKEITTKGEKRERYGCKSSVIFALGPVRSIRTHPAHEPELMEARMGAKDSVFQDFPWERLKEMMAPQRPNKISGDKSSPHWAELGPIKQKKVQVSEPGTVKLSMYCGANSWRSHGAKVRRAPVRTNAPGQAPN
jgi:hypothetical protein